MEDIGLDPAMQTLRELYTEVVGALPLVAVATVVAIVGIVVGLFVASAVQRWLGRSSADRMVVGLVGRIVRLLVVVAAILLGLAVAGVPITTALAGLGLAGLAVAFALQSILENFIAGVILLARKPFRAGDQIRSGDFEGTVAEIDLRVTRIIDFDGVLNLVPNSTVFTEPITNLTRQGKRRSVLTVGVDYRDDHDEAREVIRAAVADVDGVLAEPAPEVLLTALGDSSVDFEIWYYTEPQNATVRRIQDRVLAAAKRGIEDAGMTIPWPIRTLVMDNTLQVERKEV
jgi:small conductance mechanosensitive channel